MTHYSSLRELYLARLREFSRQPARFFWVYGFPTILAVVLGLAFRSRPQQVIDVDLVRGPAAEPVRRAIQTSNDVARIRNRPVIELHVVPAAEADRRVRTGKAALVVEAKVSPPLLYRYDPTRPEAVTARAAFDDALQRVAGRRDPVSTKDIPVDERGSRYIDFLIPGLIALNTMGGGLWGVGFLIVNFRIGKLLKRFMATPMPRRNFLLSILAARLTFLIPDVGLLLLLGVLAFRMPVLGNPAVLVLVEVVGALAFAGIGLLVASRAATTETVSGLMNLVMLPQWLLGGVFFSSERFPSYLQPLIQVLPLTQLTTSLRRVMLEGAGLATVWPSVLILGAWTVGTFFLALRLFRWN